MDITTPYNMATKNRASFSSCFAREMESSVSAKSSPIQGKFTISPPTQFISQELESPNGPLEMCNTETSPNPSTTQKFSSPSRPTTVGSFLHTVGLCPSPKPAWDMDTLKHNICAAKTGSGEVRQIIETCTFKPREQAFTTLINMCGQLRDWMKAVEVFEAMQTVRGVKSNMYTYSALIAACSSAGEWVKALEIFEQMKEAAETDRNCAPNEFTYSSLITACERGGQYHKALEVYDDMVANNVLADHITFSSVLTACEKSKNWVRAEALLEEMHARGFTGNAVIYSELLLHYAERGDWSKALSMCLSMQAAGQEALENGTKNKSRATRSKAKNQEILPLQQTLLTGTGMNSASITVHSPSSASITSLTSPKITPRTIQSPDVDSQDSSTPRPIPTNHASTAMATQPPPPLTTTVPMMLMGPGSAAMNTPTAPSRPPWDMETLKRAICFAKTGTGEVRKAFETCTFRPREQAFTALINMCGRLRDWRKAIEVFEAMKCVRGVSPNTFIYSSLIAACSSSGEWEKALGIFETMKANAQVDQSCIPNQVTYSALITACQRGGMFDRALELYHEMIQTGVKPDQITYSSVLAACEKSERWDTVEQILGNMHAQGLCGPQTIYSELIAHYADCGAYHKALHVHLAVQMLGHVPDEKMKKALMRALDKAEKYELMIELFRDMQKTGKAVDPEIINAVIHAQERINQRAYQHQPASSAPLNQLHHQMHLTPGSNMRGPTATGPMGCFTQNMGNAHHMLSYNQGYDSVYGDAVHGIRALNVQTPTTIPTTSMTMHSHAHGHGNNHGNSRGARF